VVTPDTATQCANPNPTLCQLLRGGGGARHKLHWARVVETDVPVIYCVACGGIASARTGSRLIGDCEPPSKSAERSKLVRGLYPGTNYRLGQSFPLSSLPFFPLPPLTPEVGPPVSFGEVVGYDVGRPGGVLPGAHDSASVVVPSVAQDLSQVRDRLRSEDDDQPLLPPVGGRSQSSDSD